MHNDLREVLDVGRVYGYARVSSTEQHLDRQIEALSAYGVEDRHIITDKQSGKDFSRPGYKTLKEQLLRSGDILVVKELDRLGRNYEQIKTEWYELRQMGVDIVVLDMPVLTTTDKSDLEKILIAYCLHHRNIFCNLDRHLFTLYPLPYSDISLLLRLSTVWVPYSAFPF